MSTRGPNNCDKFWYNLFKGLNFAGGQTSKFSYTKLYNSAVLL